MTRATIYHNQNCSKSRAVVELIREKRIELEIIEYLDGNMTEDVLKNLLNEMNEFADYLLRLDHPELYNEDLAKSLTENEKIMLMVKNPILINRPIVRTQKGVRLCRPIEKVYEIL